MICNQTTLSLNVLFQRVSTDDAITIHTLPIAKPSTIPHIFIATKRKCTYFHQCHKLAAIPTIFNKMKSAREKYAPIRGYGYPNGGVVMRS